MKTALYSRCSTKKQDLDSQQVALRRWADQNGHSYVEFQDFAVSGRKDSRLGINTLLENARKKEVDAVAVIELSRIGRSLGFIHGVLEELSRLGIVVYLANSNTRLDVKTLEGRALVGGLALAADIEWMLIQERNRRGREAIKEKNIKVGRKRKEISDEAIKLMSEKGMSLRKIANELGVSPPTIMRRVRYNNAHLCNVSESNEKINS